MTPINRATAVRHRGGVRQRFIPEGGQARADRTRKSLREHNGPQKSGRRFAPLTLDKSRFCGEGLSLYPYGQRQLRPSRRHLAPVRPLETSVYADHQTGTPPTRATPVMPT